MSHERKTPHLHHSANSTVEKVALCILVDSEEADTFIASCVHSRGQESNIFGIVMYPISTLLNPKTSKKTPIVYIQTHKNTNSPKFEYYCKSAELPRSNYHANQPLIEHLRKVNRQTTIEDKYLVCVAYHKKKQPEIFSDYQIGLTGSKEKKKGYDDQKLEEDHQAMIREAFEEIGICISKKTISQCEATTLSYSVPKSKYRSDFETAINVCIIYASNILRGSFNRSSSPSSSSFSSTTR